LKLMVKNVPDALLQHVVVIISFSTIQLLPVRIVPSLVVIVRHVVVLAV